MKTKTKKHPDTLLITECSGTLTYFFYVGLMNHENNVRHGGCGIITQQHGGGLHSRFFV